MRPQPIALSVNRMRCSLPSLFTHPLTPLTDNTEKLDNFDNLVLWPHLTTLFNI